MEGFLYNDLETFSSVPIQYGPARYFSAPDAEIMLWGYAIGDGPVKVWDLTLGEPMPADLEEALRDQRIKTVWHNGANFDRVGLRVLMPEIAELIPPERMIDTLVQAYMHGLPGKLDKLCEIMRVPFDQAKDKEGQRLIQLFCKPRPANMNLRRATAETHPKDWWHFKHTYTRLDIESMRVIHQKLPHWNCRPNNQLDEMALFALDQRINERGVAVDVELAEKALVAIDVEMKRLKAEIQELTINEVQSANQRDRLLEHLLAAYDLRLDDLKSSSIEKLLQDERLDDGVKELLRNRLQTATASTAKYRTLLRSNVNGVLYGLLQFCGAQRTGRWSGRIFQPQNLPRPDMEQELIELGVIATKLGMADQFHKLVARAKGKNVPLNVMKLCANMLRSCIIARPGKKLVVSDLSNIEGRGAAYLAGEEWKLKAFAALDADPDAPDIYEQSYARAFDMPPEDVDKYQRQIGKVMELALAYEGGVGAFLTFVHTYKLDLDELTRAGLATIDPEALANARGMLEWRRNKRLSTYGISDDTFVVCEALKARWREAHPEIASYWKELEEAAKEAIRRPGVTQPCRKLAFRKDGAWLRMILPSGRSLCYPSAHIDENNKLVYWGINQYSKKWTKIHTYGGKLFENACQAFARDIMAAAMFEAEQMGYEVLLTVHDELITEAPDKPEYCAAHLSKILARERSFTEGMPLAAAGFEAHRYRKDG